MLSYTIGARLDFQRTQLHSALVMDDSWTGWITSLQCFLWALEFIGKKPPEHGPFRDRVSGPDFAMKGFVAIKKAIALSPGAPLVLKAEASSVALYPRGARLLDDGLVNDNLSWLTAHPDAKSSLGKALGMFLKDDKSEFRNLLDELRKAMEELLRSVLGNGKSLENQMELLGQWLEGKGVHVQVRNMYATLLKQFATYQNDAVKHGNDWNESEVEYMIYLTGTFMRMLLVLNGDSQ